MVVRYVTIYQKGEETVRNTVIASISGVLLGFPVYADEVQINCADLVNVAEQIMVTRQSMHPKEDVMKSVSIQSGGDDLRETILRTVVHVAYNQPVLFVDSEKKELTDAFRKYIGEFCLEKNETGW
jgi:hypothetical protein